MLFFTDWVDSDRTGRGVAVTGGMLSGADRTVAATDGTLSGTARALAVTGGMLSGTDWTAGSGDVCRA